MIDEKTLSRIAEISRLKPEGKEKDELAKDLNAILGYLSQISELKDGKELLHLRTEKAKLRKDVAKKKGNETEIRKGFNSSEGNYLLAPKNL